MVLVLFVAFNAFAHLLSLLHLLMLSPNCLEFFILGFGETMLSSQKDGPPLQHRAAVRPYVGTDLPAPVTLTLEHHRPAPPLRRQAQTRVSLQAMGTLRVSEGAGAGGSCRSDGESPSWPVAGMPHRLRADSSEPYECVSLSSGRESFEPGHS